MSYRCNLTKREIMDFDIFLSCVKHEAMSAITSISVLMHLVSVSLTATDEQKNAAQEIQTLSRDFYTHVTAPEEYFGTHFRYPENAAADSNDNRTFTEEELLAFERILRTALDGAAKSLSLMRSYLEPLHVGALGPLDDRLTRYTPIAMELLAFAELYVYEARPWHYFQALFGKNLDWHCIALDVVVDRAIHNVTPYLIHGKVDISMPTQAPLIIKGDDKWLPVALAGLLYEGRHGELSLKFEVERQDIIVGRVYTTRSLGDSSTPELFHPGWRSEGRLALSRLIFDHYGDPVTCALSGEGYEFEFHLFACETETERNI